MKKVMIIGTGFGQLPLIEACRKMGYCSGGIDMSADSIGAKLVDKFYEVDVKDISAALDVARLESVNAVVTMQSDLPVPTIGMINQEMGLTGATHDTAVKCSNKDETRLALKENNVTQPKFHIALDIEQARVAVDKIGYPCIIKLFAIRSYN